MECRISIQVAGFELGAETHKEPGCGGLLAKRSQVQRSVSMDIDSVDVSAVARLISGKLENDPLVSMFGSFVKQGRAAILLAQVLHTTAQLDGLEQVSEHVCIVVLDCKEETVTLLGLTTDPLSDEYFVTLAGELRTVLEENLQTVELIGVTCENKRAEMPVHAHAAHFACDSLDRALVRLDVEFVAKCASV